MANETSEFPMDYREWEEAWATWKERNDRHLRTSSYRFPPKNILADDVLGVWTINGRPVELSEVTFMDHRSVGVTIGKTARDPQGDAFTVSSFAELEQRLGIGGDDA